MTHQQYVRPIPRSSDSWYRIVRLTRPPPGTNHTASLNLKVKVLDFVKLGWRFLNLPKLALAAQHELLFVGPLGGHYDVATTVYKPGLSVQLPFKANNCRP